MDPVDWSRTMSEIFFAHQDPNGDLKKIRHQIPDFILRTFCDNTAVASNRQMWIYDQNQIPTCVVNTTTSGSEPETLIIYRPALREFKTHHWTECFGAENIYSRFFDNLTTQRYMRENFSKFTILQQVDRDICKGLVDPIWQIQSLQATGTITLRRDDVWGLRKFLHLMTGLHSRDRTMHLLAHAPEMEDARVRRRRFIDSRGMEHPRDVWLYNAEQTLKTQHHEVHNNPSIFDLDREDYRANARERFLVFWEAGPGDEFILTENGFGGFEGGEIGARQDSIVNMGSRELEQHLYTNDFMWHQLYVLSPNLVAALCHGTLMHPDLTRAQRKRWGLRKSLLENLPHEVAPKYYKDMTKAEASFLKPGFPIPQDVEWAFGTNVSLEKRKSDEIEFPVQRLSPKQVSLVNSVLLHNQHNGPIVKSVCIKSPPQYQCLYNALVMFQQQPWDKYSAEEQNDYTPLTERLRSLPPAQPTVPQPFPVHHLQYAQAQQQQQQAYQAQQFAHQLPLHQLHQMPTMPMTIPQMQPPTEARHPFPCDRSMTMPEVPRYEQPIHESRPMHLRTNSQMSHSSHSSSFPSSSQSSQTYSSASSQTSSSSATSIEPPHFEPKAAPAAAAAREPKSRPQSPSRKAEKQRKGNSQTESVPSKPTKPVQAPKCANITIEHTVQEIQERHRGRAASRSDPAPPPMKVSPIPDRVELTASKPKPRHQPEQIKPQEQKPQAQSQPQQKPQTQTQTQPPVQQQQQQQQQKPQPQAQPQQPQQQYQKPQPQPMQQQTSQPQPIQQRFQPQPQVLQQNPLPQPLQQKASVLPERPMYVMDVMDPMRPIQTERERNEPLPQWNFGGVELQGHQYEMGLPESRAHSQQSQRSTGMTNERSSQGSEHARQRQYEVLTQDLQSHPQPCDRNSQTSETARRQQYDPRPELGQIQRPVPPTDRHSADTVSSRGRPYEPPRPEQGQIQRPLQRSSPASDGRKIEQSQPMRNTPSHERSHQYEPKPEQQQSQPMRNTGSHDRPHQYEPKPEQQQQSQPMRNTMSHDRPSHSSEHSRQRQYEFELLKPEQPKPPPVPAHKIQPQILKPQAQRPINNNISSDVPTVTVEESRGRPYDVITPEGLQQQQQQQQQQRSANSSSERQMRPGVEIVRPHALEPVRPEPRSNLQPPQVQQKPQYIDNIKVKQLRFDAKTLSHKLSNLSLDGSMIVQTGDDNETDLSDSDSDDDDEDDQSTEGEEEDDAWEDEGFAESEELSTSTNTNTKPKSTKPHVRFADRPLSRTGMRGVPVHIERPLSRLGFAGHLGRKVDFIERPSSRLGRRVEIVRPLSRNGQRACVGSGSGLGGKRVAHGHAHR